MSAILTIVFGSGDRQLDTCGLPKLFQIRNSVHEQKEKIMSHKINKQHLPMIHEIMQSTGKGHSQSFAAGGDNDLSLLLRHHFQDCNVLQLASGAYLLHVHLMAACQASPIKVNVAQLNIHIRK